MHEVYPTIYWLSLSDNSSTNKVWVFWLNLFDSLLTVLSTNCWTDPVNRSLRSNWWTWGWPALFGTLSAHNWLGPFSFLEMKTLDIDRRPHNRFSGFSRSWEFRNWTKEWNRQHREIYRLLDTFVDTFPYLIWTKTFEGWSKSVQIFRPSVGLTTTKKPGPLIHRAACLRGVSSILLSISGAQKWIISYQPQFEILEVG
jgi:hypothetical protein